MRILVHSAIIASLLSSPALAASDPGLYMQGQSASAGSRGIGAQASITIPLGDRRVVRDADKVRLGIAAGPVWSLPEKNGIGSRVAVANLTGITVRPGYSTSFTLAGQPVLQDFTRLGAAEDGQQDKPKKKHKTLKTVAIVAGAAVGVVLLAGVGLYAYCRTGSNCSD